MMTTPVPQSSLAAQEARRNRAASSPELQLAVLPAAHHKKVNGNIRCPARRLGFDCKAGSIGHEGDHRNGSLEWPQRAAAPAPLALVPTDAGDTMADLYAEIAKLPAVRRAFDADPATGVAGFDELLVSVAKVMGVTVPAWGRR